MHLHSMYDVLVGAKSMDNPIYCVEVVCATYLSLHNYYLCYASAYGYLSYHDWKFDETTKVHTFCTHIFNCTQVILPTNFTYILYN